MAKYKVILNSGIGHTVEADIVSTDPSWVQFHTRAEAGKPGVLKACFPAHTIAEIIEVTK